MRISLFHENFNIAWKFHYFMKISIFHENVNMSWNLDFKRISLFRDQINVYSTLKPPFEHPNLSKYTTKAMLAPLVAPVWAFQSSQIHHQNNACSILKLPFEHSGISKYIIKTMFTQFLSSRLNILIFRNTSSKPCLLNS